MICNRYILSELFNIPLKSSITSPGTKAIQFKKIFPRRVRRSLGQLSDTTGDAYMISMSDDILIEAYDSPGAFYAVQTLKSIVHNATGDGMMLPAIIVDDEPRYLYRGVHLDVSRNFKTKEEVRIK